jgi:hypothetical protein
METALFSETLENLQYKTFLVSENRNYTLNSDSKNTYLLLCFNTASVFSIEKVAKTKQDYRNIP